jgi:hypothetical protein
MVHATRWLDHLTTSLQASFAVSSVLFFRVHMQIDISAQLVDDADTIVLFSFELWVCKAISTVLAFRGFTYCHCLDHPLV